MRDEDLAPFAVSEGLEARIAAERAGKLTDVEHRYMLDRARETLARATGDTLEAAGRLMFQACGEGEFTLQAGNEFAIVTIYGRLLFVMSRWSWPDTATPSATSTPDVVFFPISLSG